METKYSTCNLCESMCGIKIEIEDGKILAIRGDKEDKFSRGHICPKAGGLQDIHNDPDRIRRPMKRNGDSWKEISWKEALDEVADKIHNLQSKYGNDAFAMYAGNPNVHSLGAMLMYGPFTRSLRTKNHFSATSLDQLPHHLASYLMFGHQFLIPIPDINRTNYFLILGANPVASNGSIMTAADITRRIEDIKSRNGRVIVIDPRFTETAEIATKHHFIKPGTDALFLLALIHIIYAKKLLSPGRLVKFTDGIEQLKEFVKPYSPQKVSSLTGIPASEIEIIATEFASADRAVCYGRMGVSTQEFGALSQWCVNVLNIITGRMDSEGGAMFTKPAVDIVGITGIIGEKGSFNVDNTRVRGLPSFSGEFPTSALTEEILTPGEGQIKGLFTMAGNPVLSSPNGKELEKALEGLEFMISLDFYLNETTRHAHIILPPTSPLERSNYNIVFNSFAVHNVAKYDYPIFEPEKDSKHEWQILMELQTRLTSKSFLSFLPNNWVSTISDSITNALTPELILDIALRAGPYGSILSGLTLDKLKEHLHGIDLGALTSCLPERLMNSEKRINLIPEPYIKDLFRLNKIFFQTNSKKNDFEFTLIGRRNLRSNNSWFHNLERSHKNTNRCTVYIHPADAARLNIENGGKVRVTSDTGTIEIESEITEKIMPGVISIPHGWGHNRKGSKMKVAETYPGVSINDLTNPDQVDELSGNACFNGVPVNVISSFK